MPVSSDQARTAFEVLCPVVADDHAGAAAQLGNLLELADHAGPGDRGVNDEREAFAGEVIHHGEDPEPAAVGQHIVHKVHGPARVRALRDRHGRPGSDRALPPAAAAHAEPLLAIEAEELLVV